MTTEITKNVILVTFNLYHADLIPHLQGQASQLSSISGFYSWGHPCCCADGLSELCHKCV